MHRLLVATLMMVTTALNANCFSHLHGFDEIEEVAQDPDTSSECLQVFMDYTWSTEEKVMTNEGEVFASVLQFNKGHAVSPRYEHKTTDNTDSLRKRVQLLVASHPNASIKQLNMLSHSPWREVRLAVARNEHASDPILNRLRKSNNSDISLAAQTQLINREEAEAVVEKQKKDIALTEGVQKKLGPEMIDMMRWVNQAKMLLLNPSVDEVIEEAHRLKNQEEAAQLQEFINNQRIVEEQLRHQKMVEDGKWWRNFWLGTALASVAIILGRAAYEGNVKDNRNGWTGQPNQ